MSREDRISAARAYLSLMGMDRLYREFPFEVIGVRNDGHILVRMIGPGERSGTLWEDQEGGLRVVSPIQRDDYRVAEAWTPIRLTLDPEQG